MSHKHYPAPALAFQRAFPMEVEDLSREMLLEPCVLVILVSVLTILGSHPLKVRRSWFPYAS